MTDLASRQYGFYGTHPQREIRPLKDIPELWVQIGEPSKPCLAPDDPRHGTVNGYSNLGCRCDDCKSAWRVQTRQQREARRHKPIPDRVHGTAGGYDNWFCRCDACRAANRAKRTPSPRRAEQRARTEAMYADHQNGMSIAQVAEKWGVTPGSVHSRFHTAGLSTIRHWRRQATAMYFDYCTGLSVKEVAEKWGLAEQLVSARFTRMGFARRPRSGSPAQPRIRRGVSFEDSNGVRAAEAGARRAQAASEALPRTIEPLHRQVLQLRIDDPTASLTQLASRCNPPMTKDSYASHLRRALQNAGVES